MKARLADIRSAGEHEFVYSLTKDSKAWLGKLSKIMLIVSKSSDQMTNFSTFFIFKMRDKKKFLGSEIFSLLQY